MRLAQYRLLAALFLLSLAAAPQASNMTPEKARKFVEAWEAVHEKELAEAEAELSQVRARVIQGAATKADVARAKASVNQLKKSMAAATPPILNSKAVGSIGALPQMHRDGFLIVDRGDCLTLDTVFEALGTSYDNGETFRSKVFEGYGQFVLKTFDKKRISGNRYRNSKELEVYEVVGTWNGLPLLEPFDAKAAVKMARER